MTFEVAGSRSPPLAFMPGKRMVRRLGASPPMRMSHHGSGPGPTGYKVVARLIRARKAGSPLIVIPTALSVPACSKLSRYGPPRRSTPQGCGVGQP